MTSSKQLAAHYIWPTEKYEIKSPMLDIRPDGTLVFQEMFSGALEYFYKGLSGWIYHCEGDYEYTMASILENHLLPIVILNVVKDLIIEL